MADPVLKTIFTANGTEAEKVVAQLERKVEGLEQKYKRIGATSKDAARSSKQSWDQSNGSIDKMISGITTATTRMAPMLAVVKAISSSLKGGADEIKRFNADVSGFWDKQRALDTKLAIQGGFTPAEVASQFPAMKKALFATPSAPVGEAVELQTQLAGAGFKPADVQSGAALKTMLDLKAVTNSFGEGTGDPKETVLGMSQLIKGLGNVDPTARDIRRIGAKVATLMAESDIQFSDLGQLSSEASTLKQFGMSESEQLGSFSWLRDVKGAEEGATGLRIFASRTATAGTDKGRAEALKSIGLRPEDVAMAQGGVTFGQAIQRIQAGMANLSEEDKNKFLVNMYGEKGQATAAVMLDQVGAGKIRQRIGMAEGGEAAFNARLETFQGSRDAMMRRHQNETDFTLREEALKGMTWGEIETIRKHAMTTMMERQDNPASRRAAGIVGWAGGGYQRMMEGMGYTPEGAGVGLNSTEMLQLQEKQLEEARRLNKTMEEIKNQKPIDRNGQVE